MDRVVRVSYLPRMESKISESGSTFVTVLRSFQTGGITYSDFLDHVNRHLARGALPAELLEVIRRRQLIEPLPDYAHDAVARLLNAPISALTPAAAATDPLSAPPTPAIVKPAADAPRFGKSTTAPLPVPQPLVQLPGVSQPVAPLAAVSQPPVSRPAFPTQPALSRAAPLPNVLVPAPPLSKAAVPQPVVSQPPIYPPAASQPKVPAPAVPRPPLQQPIVSQPSVAPPAAPRPVLSQPPHYQPAASLPEIPAPASPRPLVPQTTALPAFVPHVKPQPISPPPFIPIIAQRLTAAPEMVPETIGPLEKTTVIPRAGTADYDYTPPPEWAAAIAQMPVPLEPSPAWQRRTTSKTWVVWLAAAVIVVVVGWIYGRSSGKIHSAHSSVSTASIAAPMPLALAPKAVAAAGTLIRDCPTCPQMTVLPAGRFKQGSAYDDHDALPSERPQHVVLIRHPFALSTHELTVDNFSEFVAATGRELRGCEIYDGEWRHQADADWKNPGFAQGSDHPITCVSWNDAMAYAVWLSAKTGHHYRLPSASEWEYAARAGSDVASPWNPSGTEACADANVADRSAARRYPKWSVFACKDGFVNTAPVGSFQANAFGIHDMLGNVFEWTEDCWHDNYAKAPIDGSARRDGDCSEHELRGGSWFSSPAFVRLSYRNHFATDYRSSSIGIRLVRDL